MPLINTDFLKVGEEWPPKSESARLDDYNASRRLFEGQHDVVFDSWWRTLRRDHDASLEMMLNWPKRLSTLWADLVAGDPPAFAVGAKDSAEQQQLDDVVERNQFGTLLYDIAIDISRYGEGLFKIRLEDSESIIEGQSPSYWFPVVSVSNVRQINKHVLAWPFDAIARSGPGKTRGDELMMIKVEIHEKGRIEHQVLAVGKNKKIQHQESLEAHFPGLPDSEDTGIDDFLVHQAPGLRPIDRLHGLNDYADAESIVQEMEVRLAQIARILDGHADPTPYGPEGLISVNRYTGQSEFQSGSYIPVPEDNQIIPGYLTWDGHLAEAFQELDELKAHFYHVTETSPAAFGQADAGLATSGTALRRLMQAPLAKARRMRMRLDPVAKTVLKIAIELEGKTEELNTPLTKEDRDAAA